MENILHFSELDSTNTYLKNNYSVLADGTVVTADTQTAGRGRFDRRWISQEGGLYFSVLLKPSKTDFIANFTQLMALSVCRAAEDLGIRATIKWPNDVLVDGKKLCGILSEVVAQGDKIACVVVGCGVNVAQKDVSFVGQPAVSLANLGVEIFSQTFLKNILNYFWQDYSSVEEKGFAALRAAYLARFAYIGKTICIKNGTKNISGVATGVSDSGALLIDGGNGPEEILIGDVMI